MIIKLFGGLRKKAGAAELNESGATIRDGLEKICAQNEELGSAIFDDNKAELRPHIRIMVSGVDSELTQGLETAVNEDDQLAIFPPIAGG